MEINLNNSNNKNNIISNIDISSPQIDINNNLINNNNDNIINNNNKKFKPKTYIEKLFVL